MRISSVRGTYCFVARGDRLAQVVRVVLAEAPPDTLAEVALSGAHLAWSEPWRGSLSAARAGRADGPAWVPGTDAGLAAPARFTAAPDVPDGVVAEVPVIFDPAQAPGTTVMVRTVAQAGGARAEAEGEVVVREPGWRMLMVPHFHYDPVWWNTQAGYTSGWDELVWALERRETFQHSGLALVEAHLERTRVDPLYKVVFAEVDYLKPFWDLYPDRRQELRDLITAGRVEIVGGTYNEPNTNLTGAETGIRAAVYGIGFRDVMGADPQSAWQLDVFGHDPQFPGIMAEAGLTSSAWARGPFHQWGPKAHAGSTAWMQFPSEFEWVAPNGQGLLTSYMPTHYSAGWELERATTVEGAMWRAYELLEDLAQVAATKVTLLPVGTDYTPPSRWVTEVARAWGRRYAWPRFEVALPREFFDAVRSELSGQGRTPSPQTRDMNPVYAGKDVSFIDTKQAQRLAEAELADAEALAALAAALGAPVPRRELDKAWRQLVFNAHHDGITGSESDQVYLDLLGGWREAYELASQVAGRAGAHLVEAIDTRAPSVTGATGATGATSATSATEDGDGRPAVVFNTVGWDRSGLAVMDVLAPPAGQVVEVADGAGQTVPVLCEPSPVPGSVRLSFRADDVPGVGYSTFRLRHQPGAAPAGAGGGPGPSAWTGIAGVEIANEHLEIAADPARGGGLSRVTDRSSGFELVPAGDVGNELLVYPEYANHPRFGEGPWHLLPLGPPARSGSEAATVRAERSDLGQRLIVQGGLRGFGYRQVVTLWNGARRAELRTELHGWAIQDHLLRLRFPTTLAGGTPVSAVGDAVVARGFGLIDVDSAEQPWTLDNPAAEWFGVSTTLVVEAAEAGRSYHRRGVGVAELVTPVGAGAAAWARRLVVALVQKGVTATCAEADRNRYGSLHGDSNLPDFRVAVGGPDQNSFVADVLPAAGPAYRAALDEQLARQGWARLLVPAARSLREVWQPGADLRGPLDLPVIVVAGTDDASTVVAVDALVAEVTAGRVVVEQPATLIPHPEQVPEWTAALLNRGTPSFAVDSSGALHVSLLRACTGWPSGVWIDPPRRFAPDGSAFELEHWSHVFDNALFLGRGDWRQAGCVEEALAYNRPLWARLTGTHDGPLPPSAGLLRVRPRPGPDGGGRAVLAVVKPAGNSLAAGDPGPGPATPSSGTEVTLRIYEAYGHPAEVEVDSAFPIVGASRANLLEVRGEPLPLTGGAASGGAGTGSLRLALAASELATFRLDLGPASWTSGPGTSGRGTSGPGTSGPGGDPGAEVAQPVFSRYWLHNKGPAPMGNQALAVHVLPAGLVLRGGEAGGFIAQVASGSAHSTQSGRMEVLAPPDWDVKPSGQIFSLSAGAWVQVPVRLEVPVSCRPGRHFVAVRVDGPRDQSQEDVLTVDVLPGLAEAASGLARGEALEGPGGLLAKPAALAHTGGQVEAELEVVLETLELAVAPQGTATLGIMLNNRTASPIRGELQLLSPVETWPYVGPWAQGFALGPGQRIRAEAWVRSPETGWLDSWALFKVTYFGRLWYSPTVALRLGTRAGA